MLEWNTLIKLEEVKPYFKSLEDFLQKEIQGGKTIFPEPQNRYKAFDLCPFDAVKVVIIGQDPYHDLGQANGLSFSVPKGIDIPPSLRNIFKEISSDLNLDTPQHGDLEYWAKQGVLLLNTCLSVESHLPASHQNKGWEIFTDEMILALSKNRSHLVFMLWGKHARSKKKLIAPKHLVLEAAHPSPLSAYRGFFDCKHFSQCNAYLNQNQIQAIDWQIR